jgi:hypothetical protein
MMSRYRILLFLHIACVTLCIGSAAPAQEMPQIEAAPPKTESQTLSNIISAKESLQEELHAATRQLKQAKTEEEKASLSKTVEELSGRIHALDKDFKQLATGVDISQFDGVPEKIDWQKELESLFAPLVDGMKKMTARPRELELLRNQVAQTEKRIELTNSAVNNLDQQLKQLEALEQPDKADAALVKKELKALLQSWMRRSEELNSRLAASKQQLDDKEQEDGLVFSSLRNALRHQGVDLTLAFAALIAVVLLMNYAKQQIYRKTGLGRLGAHRSFLLRLGEISYYFCTMLAAVSSFLIVLYLRTDWIMLGLSLFLLFGLAWAGKQALPVFWEQVKMLLNLSTVREGERLIYQGLPWRVLPINIYTKLHNPDLRGGMIRLPISSLVGLQSRPFYKDEPWFPTKTGDLVTLSDGAIGTVSLQTPEQVVLETKNGCFKTYPTLTFLSLNPINYSANTFGVFAAFGLDYDCQAEITRTIPKLLHEHIMVLLAEEEYGSDLLELLVDFQEAAGSSLNLLLAVKFPGSQAGNYFAISRFLQRAGVDACNKYGWGIPFMQITLHQAEAERSGSRPCLTAATD